MPQSLLLPFLTAGCVAGDGKLSLVGVFFSKLFSGGLVSWECARDVEMLLQKVGFPGKC